MQTSDIRKFFVRPYWSPKTQLNIKSTLSPLINYYRPNLISKVKLKKPTSTLYKPFDNINKTLDSIKEYKN